MAVEIGMLLFPGLNQLDLTGPFEVLHRVPGARVHLVWKETALVRADSGLELRPTATLDGCPPLDVLFVPGGFGQWAVQTDETALAFLRAQGARARYVTSVCTGALVLGAAGLLEGYQATTHWAYVDLLKSFGARYRGGRVVEDRNRITGGGVTAGIDFGLRLLGRMAGDRAAQMTELTLEYAPAPPFGCGTPELAGPALTAAVRRRTEERLEREGVGARLAALRGRA
jgi:cyclohexyl-isocyanide hydratase